ncbi:MAG: histidine phosphatase family protein [Pirellulaceae bacterium]|jgi:broad specificity phosphatase PhoE
MFRIVLVRPGATSLDEQRRIKGSLDIPLSPIGSDQAKKLADDLAGMQFDVVYSAPCESAVQTARMLADRSKSKVRVVDALRNLDHGLWQGKLIDEVRKHQPKVYRQFQDDPESICPPGGETVEQAKQRVRKTLNRWIHKHDASIVAIVVPEPLASIIKEMLGCDEIGDLWQAECDRGQWEIVQGDPHVLDTQAAT